MSLAERMAMADGCPSCVANVETPHAVEENDGDPEFIAHYRCGHCRHHWYTSWKDN